MRDQSWCHICSFLRLANIERETTYFLPSLKYECKYNISAFNSVCTKCKMPER